MDRKIFRRIKSLHNKALNAKRICYTPGCMNYAQNSHVLQKNGILNQISEGGFIRQLDTDTKQGFIEFKRAGINSTDIMSFPGFCNSCDTRIFLPIESNNLDFSNLNHLLLFTYRAIVCELHKADSWLACCDKIISDEWYSDEIKEFFVHQKINYTVRRNGFINHQFVIGNILFKDTGKWSPTFYVFRIPRQEVVCSAIYCPYIELDETLAGRYLNSKASSYAFPFFHTSVYFHCIPTDNELVVILGFHKGVSSIEGIPIEDLKYLKDEHVLLLVSTMLIKRVETWAVSETVHERWKKEGILGLILKTSTKYIDDCANNVDMFNIFPSNLIPIGKYTWDNFKPKKI